MYTERSILFKKRLIVMIKKIKKLTLAATPFKSNFYIYWSIIFYDTGYLGTYRYILQR